MWKSRSASSNLVFTIKNRPTYRNGKIIPEMLADGRRALVTAGCDNKWVCHGIHGCPYCISHQNGQFWEYPTTNYKIYAPTEMRDH